MNVKLPEVASAPRPQPNGRGPAASGPQRQPRGASPAAPGLDFVAQRKLALCHKVSGKELDMNDETGTTSVPGSGEAAMDAQGAAVIMQQASERAGSELRIRRPVLFVTWAWPC